MGIERYRNVIIGSGEGGKYLAWHLAGSGEQTVVIERQWIGGSCPNINCLPAKNEIWSAKVANLVRNAAEFGAMTGPGLDRYGGGAQAQARDGGWAGRGPREKVQGDRR